MIAPDKNKNTYSYENEELSDLMESEVKKNGNIIMDRDVMDMNILSGGFQLISSQFLKRAY
jgi:hypothetical protein